MMNSFYGLSCNPFSKQAQEIPNAFQSNDFKVMQDRLGYLVDVRGIGVFTAPPGMGKTHAIRCFERSLNKNLYQTEYICLATVSVPEFYAQFCGVLGLEPAYRKATMFKQIQDQIYYYYKEKHKPLVLVIDEAQYLNSHVLDDVKLLMNFEYDSLNCFTLILSGEPRLNITLSKAVNEALRQRITVHYEFQGLDPDEVSRYVSHKLRAANGSDSIMMPDAMSALVGACSGNPRIIDNIMTAALTLGAQLKKASIDADVIMGAVNELGFSR